MSKPSLGNVKQCEEKLILLIKNLLKNSTELNQRCFKIKTTKSVF